MAKCLQQDSEFSVLEAKLTKCWRTDYAIYEIQINIKGSSIYWNISKRYSEFYELHKKLCKVDESVKGIYFPPKKPFNNLASKFLFKRLEELEVYLNTVLTKFPLPPVPLAHFIDWNFYEIHGITNLLARNFFENGDLILQRGFQFEFSVLQIFAINERLNSQSPTNLSDEVCTDFVHVIEFVGQARNVKVTGSTNPVHSSNIVMNKLELDLSRFSSVEQLELSNIDLRQMRGFDKLKTTVKSLKVSHSLDSIKILALGDLLSLGNGDWVFGRDSVPTTSWQKAQSLDLADNYLHGLDPSMALFRHVEKLKLSNNLLVDVQHLDLLDSLRSLNLSHNKLGLVYVSSNLCPEPTLRGRLGNITDLDLSYNDLVSAKLVEGLFSLTKLNMGGNSISELQELSSLQSLPCLESLILLGNPVCSSPGYRRFTLLLFGDRFDKVKLDLRLPDNTEFSQLQSSLSDSFQRERINSSAGQRESRDMNSVVSSFSVEDCNSPVQPRDLEVSIEAEINEICIF